MCFGITTVNTVVLSTTIMKTRVKDPTSAEHSHGNHCHLAKRYMLSFIYFK